MPVRAQQDTRETICAFTKLRRASRAISHLYDVVLAPTGLKASQFMILRVVSESGEIAQCDLMADFAISLESLSRRLSWARNAGLLTMRVGTHGRRLYRLTESGAERLETAWPYWERAQARLQESLGAEDWDTMCALIDRVSDAAQKAETLRRRNGKPAPVPLATK